LIRNIIFDLGNVLLKFEPEKFLLRFTNNLDYINEFISKVIHTKIWLKLDKGLLTVAKAREIFISQHLGDKDMINLFFDNWLEMFIPIKRNVEILYLLKDNKYKLYILSNFMMEVYSYVKSRYDFFSLFDGQIISGEKNVIKPDIEIYKLLLNQYNLIANECVFIDDVIGFLRPAKKLGINTIWHRPNTDLKEELKKVEILV